MMPADEATRSRSRRLTEEDVEGSSASASGQPRLHSALSKALINADDFLKRLNWRSICCSLTAVWDDPILGSDSKAESNPVNSRYNDVVRYRRNDRYVENYGDIEY